LGARGNVIFHLERFDNSAAKSALVKEGSDARIPGGGGDASQK
jgi:hypothetical protein